MLDRKSAMRQWLKKPQRVDQRALLEEIVFRSHWLEPLAGTPASYEYCLKLVAHDPGCRLPRGVVRRLIGLSQ